MQSQGPYAIAEIPLLTNRADYPYLKRILLIEASHEQKIKRLMLRDRASREQVLAMLAIQPKQVIRQKMADDVVVNNGDMNDLSKKIAVLHKKYCRLSHAL
jgi:dephospho-CoA kinase